MKNEVKTSDMIDILHILHQYVPTLSSNKEVSVSGSSESDKIRIDHFHKILIQGDQLTVERVRSAQGIRDNAHNGREKLKGFIPIVADWHAKVTLLDVSCTYCNIVHLCF